MLVYLDTRSVGKAAFELQQGTTDFVLHGRPALLVVVMVVVVVDLLAGNRGARNGGGTATAKEATAAGGGGRGRSGDDSARVVVTAVGKGHDGLEWFLTVVVLMVELGGGWSSLSEIGIDARLSGDVIATRKIRWAL